MGSHFGVGELATHVRTYFSGWSGMFTGTIWILTHGLLSASGPEARASRHRKDSAAAARKGCHQAFSCQETRRAGRSVMVTKL